MADQKPDSAIWSQTFEGDIAPADQAFRDRLLVSLEDLRSRGRLLAGEIARDLPDFTVHDETHSQALWSLAGQIGGPELKLTPTEGYVFGAAAVIHDLGMAAAAYIPGIGALEDRREWSDTVAYELRRRSGHPPTPAEIANPGVEIRHRVKAEVLRRLHAEKAEDLASLVWTDHSGNQISLIDDSLLRQNLGSVIGKIAHSHWWSVDYLDTQLPLMIGPPASWPTAWTIRPLLIAGLLRLADASHLDASRAPSFLRSIRRITSDSELHWAFQSRLSQPFASGDRLLFTSSPFPASEAEAWWLCSDALQLLDRECRSVDALLADKNQARFQVKGVAGVENPERLAKLLPVESWTPVDARVGVSNVVRLVERLGGQALYGDLPEIPLRELFQNGSDAIRARRALENRADDWGAITVSVFEGGDGDIFLEVTDSGVGMSPKVLSQDLLDFGNSLWESASALEELPGLLGSRFEPTGQFGIGFFSIFMWAEEIAVTSRRYEAATVDTYVLEFSKGVQRRPLLRRAHAVERLVEPGTSIKVRLDLGTAQKLGISMEEHSLKDLASVCSWLAPASDVAIDVKINGHTARAVSANDWIAVDICELVGRLGFGLDSALGRDDSDSEGDNDPSDLIVDYPTVDSARGRSLAALNSAARQLHDEHGRVIGRLAVDFASGRGVVTVGGFRSVALRDVTGVLDGQATTATRQAALPRVSPEVLADWATAQAALIEAEVPAEAKVDMANVIWRCGGDTGNLPIATTSEGTLSYAELVSWLKDFQEVILLQDAAYGNDARTYGSGFDLFRHVALIPMVPAVLVGDEIEGRAGTGGEIWPTARTIPGLEFHEANCLLGAVVLAARQAWAGCGIDSGDEARDEHQVGERSGEIISLSAHLLTRAASTGSA